MFEFNTLPTSTKKEILEMLYRYISSGMNLYNAIESSSNDVKDKKMAQVLHKTKLDADRLNDTPLALKNNKIINEREYTILVNAKRNIRIALKEIIKLSDGGTMFEKTMLKAVVIPTLIFTAAMYAPYFIAPYLKGIFDEYKKTLSINIKLDWYYATVVDYAHIYAIIATLSLATLSFFIFFYYYSYRSNIALAYRVFKYKALVDAPYILNLMVSLHKSTGMNLTFVCTTLKNTITPKSLAYFFRKIEKEKDNSNLFNTMVNFGIERGVARVCSLGQNKGINDFWLNMDKGLKFAEQQLDTANEKYNVIAKRNLLLSIFVVIAILLNSIGYVTLMSNKLEKTLKAQVGRNR